MFKNLVVALDLDHDGDRALPIVRALAAAGPRAVELVTVSEPGMPTAADAFELEQRAVRYGWDRNSWTVVHDVDAAGALVQHAARHDGSLLVMATSGKRPMTSSVFGSVTHEVLRRSEGPVLLIGPNVPADYAPSSTTLVLGVARGALDEHTIPAIVSWQSSFVSNEPLVVEVVGSFEDDRPAQRRLAHVATDLAAQHVHASTRVEITDDPIAGLIDVAAGLEDAVFVAMSARYTDGRLHWHSTTQQLVAHATCPVLVVPAHPLVVPMRPVLEDHIAFHDRTTPACDVAAAAAGTARSES